MEKESNIKADALPDQIEKNDVASDQKGSVTNAAKKDIEEVENSDTTKIPQKITHFFPVLRSNVRARMGSSEGVIDKGIIARDASKGAAAPSTATGKSDAANTKIKGIFSNLPNKNFSDILNTALKTSLSEVLRKNIEANSSEASKDRLRNVSNERAPSTIVKGADNLTKSPGGDNLAVYHSESNCDPNNKNISIENSELYSAGKSFEAATNSNIQEGSTSHHKAASSKIDVSSKSTNPNVPSKPVGTKHTSKMFASTSSTHNKSAESGVSSSVHSGNEMNAAGWSAEGQCEEGIVIKTEEMDVNDSLISEPVTTLNVKKENSSEPIVISQNEKLIKPKKGKKRHFKGATYSLYLTPHRKKKKYKKKHVNELSTKDDEMSLTSTENGSYLDSSDACSMFSDDMNTSSERSLADDEACSNSQCSPLHLLAEQRMDMHDFKAETCSQNAVSGTKVVPPNDQPNDPPETAQESQENHEPTQEENKLAENVPSPEPEVDVKELEKENYPMEEICTNIQTSESDLSVGLNNTTTTNTITTTTTTTTVSRVGSTRKSASSYSTAFNEQILVSKIKLNLDDKGEVQCKNKAVKDLSDQASLQYTFSGSNDLEGNSFISSDIIENFKISLNTEARGGPLTKIESVFSAKKYPIDTCTCHGVTFEVKVGDSPTNFYCQAVDSYDEKLVGCSNPVVTFRLIRPSVRIPFTVMCEMHLWRMKQHHCCPRCGVFCSQGTFVQCTAENYDGCTVHLFHEHCRGISEEGKFDFCLHCGKDTHLKSICLECEMMSPPSFFQSQLSLTILAKARISFGGAQEIKSEEYSHDSENIYKTDDGKLLTYEGLPENDAATLEGMLLNLKSQNICELADYPTAEMYDAALNGDVQKVLHMLVKGVNPNEKFPEYEGSISLHAAAMSGNVLITHLLLQAGAVSDTMNKSLRTPLMIATEKNHEGVAECLVKRKAPLNTKGEVGMTVLHLAARDGYLKLCKMFLDTGTARINAQDDGGWTPIVWASEHGHSDVVNLLINRGGDPNIRDNEGNTALHWAAFCGALEVCTLLLNHGCNSDETNEHGDTPLHIAARQDNFKCIDFLLSRSVNLEIKNKAGELALDCCLNNPNSKSYQAIRLNMSLKEIFKFHHLCEKIVSKDIARGRERYPIRCVNGIDDAELQSDEFLYVTENCETCPIKIDRCITSLQHCNCVDDCTISSCTCSAISFKCWYDNEGHLLPEFNMLDPPLLFECNRACSCDAGICRNRVVQRGMTCRLELMRTVGKGWGVRTLKDIPKGTFICEYVGELITDSEADTRQDDSYLFDLDNKDGETYCLDARHFGNISRFINHLCEPNLVPVKVFINHQDLSFPRIAFFSLRDIFQYEELGFDYGEKFWVIKSKSFTCNCESVKCKYSEDTIKETLENYHNRVREELHEEVNMSAT